jgi:hypothetical protein
MVGSVDSLRRRHASLEAELSDLERCPAAHATRIREIKAEKLRIKDQIAALQRAEAAAGWHPWMGSAAAGRAPRQGSLPGRP